MLQVWLRSYARNGVDPNKILFYKLSLITQRKDARPIFTHNTFKYIQAYKKQLLIEQKSSNFWELRPSPRPPPLPGALLLHPAEAQSPCRPIIFPNTCYPQTNSVCIKPCCAGRTQKQTRLHCGHTWVARCCGDRRSSAACRPINSWLYVVSPVLQMLLCSHIYRSPAASSRLECVMSHHLRMRLTAGLWSEV